MHAILIFLRLFPNIGNASLFQRIYNLYIGRDFRACWCPAMSTQFSKYLFTHQSPYHELIKRIDIDIYKQPQVGYTPLFFGDTEGFFPGLKRVRREAVLSFPSSAEV
jgi:hypothetical protein